MEKDTILIVQPNNLTLSGWTVTDLAVEKKWIICALYCMLVNYGPSQQSSKEEYKSWKWGATARYYASHKKRHVTNEEVHGRIQQAIGPYKDLLTIVETQTAVVWWCHLLIRSGQNHLARHSERGTKTRQTAEEVGRHQGMDRPGVRQVPEGNGEQGKWRKLVVKSSVVSQLTSRLRDRWWWCSKGTQLHCWRVS